MLTLLCLFQFLGKAVLLPLWVSWHLPFFVRFLYYTTKALVAHGRASFGMIPRAQLREYLPSGCAVPPMLRVVLCQNSSGDIEDTLPRVVVPLWFAYRKACGKKLTVFHEYTGVPPIVTVLRWGDVPAFRVLLALEVHTTIVTCDHECESYVRLVHKSLPVALMRLVKSDFLTEEVWLLVLHHLLVHESRAKFRATLADIRNNLHLFEGMFAAYADFDTLQNR
jgi:hypothetical protein